jgi:hypothetical protein
MALDTTVGGATADSYASLAEANAYHAARKHNDEWTDAGEADKESALKWAARQLDANFTFRGTRSTKDQARAWPRSGAVDDDGFELESDEMPKLLKEAQAEYALHLLREDWTQGVGPILDEGIQVGPIKTTKSEHQRMPDAVSRILRPLISGGAGNFRVIDLEVG